MNIRSVLFTIILSIISVYTFSYYSHGYATENNYSIQFDTKKAKGNLYGLTGTVAIDTTNLDAAEIDVLVDVATIKTGNDKKDKHARGKKWFDSEKYPNIAFTSDYIYQQDESYIAEGKLTIKDVKKEVAIAFDIEEEGDQSFLVGQLNLNRKDFNINGNAFGFLVGKNVDVLLKFPYDKSTYTKEIND